MGGGWRLLGEFNRFSFRGEPFHSKGGGKWFRLVKVRVVPTPVTLLLLLLLFATLELFKLIGGGDFGHGSHSSSEWNG